MNITTLFEIAVTIVAMITTLCFFGSVIMLFLFFYRRSRWRKPKRHGSRQTLPLPVSSLPFQSYSSSDEKPDIATLATYDIPRSGLFSAYERKVEYRRRGKSPSGVIDGVYNDMNREDGHSYNDMDRDWDADA